MAFKRFHVDGKNIGVRAGLVTSGAGAGVSVAAGVLLGGGLTLTQVSQRALQRALQRARQLAWQVWMCHRVLVVGASRI